MHHWVHPTPQGSVCAVGHSLGSVLLNDILCHQPQQFDQFLLSSPPEQVSESLPIPPPEEAMQVQEAQQQQHDDQVNMEPSLLVDHVMEEATVDVDDVPLATAMKHADANQLCEEQIGFIQTETQSMGEEELEEQQQGPSNGGVMDNALQLQALQARNQALTAQLEAMRAERDAMAVRLGADHTPPENNADDDMATQLGLQARVRVKALAFAVDAFIMLGAWPCGLFVAERVACQWMCTPMIANQLGPTHTHTHQAPPWHCSTHCVALTQRLADRWAAPRLQRYSLGLHVPLMAFPHAAACTTSTTRLIQWRTGEGCRWCCLSNANALPCWRTHAFSSSAHVLSSKICMHLVSYQQLHAHSMEPLLDVHMASHRACLVPHKGGTRTHIALQEFGEGVTAVAGRWSATLMASMSLNRSSAKRIEEGDETTALPAPGAVAQGEPDEERAQAAATAPSCPPSPPPAGEPVGASPKGPAGEPVGASPKSKGPAGPCARPCALHRLTDGYASYVHPRQQQGRLDFALQV